MEAWDHLAAGSVAELFLPCDPGALVLSVKWGNHSTFHPMLCLRLHGIDLVGMGRDCGWR